MSARGHDLRIGNSLTLFHIGRLYPRSPSASQDSPDSGQGHRRETSVARHRFAIATSTHDTRQTRRLQTTDTSGAYCNTRTRCRDTSRDAYSHTNPQRPHAQPRYIRIQGAVARFCPSQKKMRYYCSESEFRRPHIQQSPPHGSSPNLTRVPVDAIGSI